MGLPKNLKEQPTHALIGSFGREVPRRSPNKPRADELFPNFQNLSANFSLTSLAPSPGREVEERDPHAFIWVKFDLAHFCLGSLKRDEGQCRQSIYVSLLLKNQQHGDFETAFDKT